MQGVQAYRHWWPRPRFSLFLLVLWLLMMNSLNPGQILLGAAFAWLIPFVTQPFWPEKPIARKPGLVIRYLLRFLREMVYSNLEVAVMIMGRPKRLQPAFIRYPLSLKDEFAITVLSSTISLTPGTVSVGLSPDRSTLLIHSLHAPEQQKVIDSIHSKFEVPLKEVFG